MPNCWKTWNLVRRGVPAAVFLREQRGKLRAASLLEAPLLSSLERSGALVTRDRAALCIAIPPLGLKAIKEIEAYRGAMMSIATTRP